MKQKMILTIILVSLMLSGCVFQTEMPYEFRQDFDQIVTIEILKKEYDSGRADTPMEVLKTLDPTEHRSFIDNLLKVEGGCLGLEPGTGFGVYIIRITYLNGEREMIGNYNNGYVTTDGLIYEDIYCFDTEQYYDLISNVMGEEITDYTYG